MSSNNEDSNRTSGRVAELSVEAETVRYHHREPPPPYTPVDTVVTNQPVIQQTVIIQVELKDRPTYYDCPACQERVLTKVHYGNSSKTHMIAGCICGATCWWCICCLAIIPYIVPTFKKAQHYCPNCNKFLGSYSKV